ncbi:MAG: ParB/RepB/Spo0J family partition protein [Alphaproteobacteria bacterium]
MSDTPRSGSGRGLGRGLSALLDGGNEDYVNLERVRHGRDVPTDSLEPNRFQPRRHFDPEELENLTNSVREKGVLQPIVVRRKAEDPDHYEIVAGERRWRAAQAAQLHRVPVIVKELTDSESLEIAIVENVQRQDLNAIEEAEGYKHLIDDFGHTQEALSKLVGKSRSHVANAMRLLGLPDGVQTMVRDGQLSAGHARTLIGAAAPESLAETIVKRGLSVRQAEKLSKDTGGKTARAKLPAAPESQFAADSRALEQELSTKLGLPVQISFREDESGEVRIGYTSLEQLDDLCRRLMQSRPS